MHFGLNTVFQHLVAELQDITQPADLQITSSEYKSWRKLESWYMLQGFNYGQGFCKHFKIQDKFLYTIADKTLADERIKQQYLR